MSPVVNVNLGKPQDFEPIEAGQYASIVKKVEPFTAGSGRAMFKVEFWGSAGTVAEGKRFWNNYGMDEETGWAFNFLLEACGIETPDDDDEDARANFKFDTDDLLEKEVLVTVTIEEYQGKDSNVVKRVDPIAA